MGGAKVTRAGVRVNKGLWFGRRFREASTPSKFQTRGLPTAVNLGRPSRTQPRPSPGLAGFSIADSQGRWTGLDVDFCRAVAAAIFGDANQVQFKPTSAQQRFTIQ